MLRWYLLLFVTLFLRALPSHATEMLHQFRSAYHLGMGDAGMAGVTGTDAIFYNPAGMSEVKGILNEVSAVSPTVMLSTNSKNLASQVQKGGFTGGANANGIEGALDLAKQLQFKPQGATIENFTGVAFRRAGFGVLTTANLNALVGSNKLGLPTIDAGVNARVGVYAAAARGFMNETLFLGVTYKYLYKAEYKVHLDALDFQSRQEEIMNEIKGASKCGDYLKCGTANAVDIGMIWKDEHQDLKPRLGIVMHNVGNAKFSTSAVDGTAPTTELASLDLSAGIEPQTKRSGMRLYLDYVDVLNRTKENTYKHLHAGAEISFAGIVGVMGGVNQGYPSYGAFLNVKVVRLEGGIFTEEVGNYPGDIPDRRYFGRILVGWAQ